MIRELLSICVALTCALSATVCMASASYYRQDGLRSKVAQALSRPFPLEAEASRNQILALGTPAIPFIIERIESAEGLTLIKQAFLIDLIARMDDQQSASALIKLLGDSNPRVRGLAASFLGKKKVKVAIPHLINALQDKEVYLTTVHTHPATEEEILVRDVALEALTAITGITLAQQSSREIQVKEWLRWWQTEGLAQNTPCDSQVKVKLSARGRIDSKKKRSKAVANVVWVPPACHTTKPIEVGVMDAIALDPIQPQYPPDAKDTKVFGVVSVQVVVDEKGSVITATAIDGPSLLHRAAVKAAYQERFPPTLLSGVPVKITGKLNYKFIPE